MTCRNEKTLELAVSHQAKVNQFNEHAFLQLRWSSPRPGKLAYYSGLYSDLERMNPRKRVREILVLLLQNIRKSRFCYIIMALVLFKLIIMHVTW